MSEENHEQRHERIELQIAFIVDQQSKFLTDIDRLRERQNQQSENIDRLTSDIQALKESQAAMIEVQTQTSADVRDLARIVAALANTVSRSEVQAEADRQEMRDGFARGDARIEAERQEMREGFARMDVRMDRFEAQAESDRQEIREAVDKLITATEDTRRFAQEIAALATKTERRVTDLENRQ